MKKQIGHVSSFKQGDTFAINIWIFFTIQIFDQAEKLLIIFSKNLHSNLD